MNSRILVTGITGFAGNHLRQLLENSGNEVFGTTQVPGKAEKNILVANLADKPALDSLLQKLQPTHIYHLAALSAPSESFGREDVYREINVGGTKNLLEAASGLQAMPRVLFISSAEVYGSPSPEALPITEDSPIHPNNPYARTKVEAERVVQEFIAQKGMDIVIARPFNHYGLGQSEKFAFPSFARQIARIEKGLQEPLLLVGNLTPKRDVTSVLDTVRAYQSLMEKGETGEAYNICSGTSRSMEDYLGILCSFSSKEITIKTDTAKLRPVEIMDNCGSYAKLNRTTGWNPEISVETGLRELFGHYLTEG